eukprot:9489715-Prorocentrum_lima.AAC.1
MSPRVLRELTRINPQRTLMTSPAQESASSNFNPAGILGSSTPRATGNANPAPALATPTAPMQDDGE